MWWQILVGVVQEVSKYCNNQYIDLKSLYVYFNGEYTEQAIMWHENVSRDDMKRLLATFDEVLLTYQL